MNSLSFKTNRMTTNSCRLHQSGISVRGTLLTAANKFPPTKKGLTLNVYRFPTPPLNKMILRYLNDFLRC